MAFNDTKNQWSYLKINLSWNAISNKSFETLSAIFERTRFLEARHRINPQFHTRSKTIPISYLPLLDKSISERQLPADRYYELHAQKLRGSLALALIIHSFMVGQMFAQPKCTRLHQLVSVEKARRSRKKKLAPFTPKGTPRRWKCRQSSRYFFLFFSEICKKEITPVILLGTWLPSYWTRWSWWHEGDRDDSNDNDRFGRVLPALGGVEP